ncbi:MAG: bifunctional lysylphosphatidylglycerol flippase/synthetase MprF [Myxococcales bacterium]|nr:bifunctional lysylphosphatidylglycerol flippase/synthetase MprF [Myxococcales bacterium]
MATHGAHPVAVKSDKLRFLRPVLGALLFAVALFALDHQLREHSLAEIRERLAAISMTALAAALVLTVASYATLTLFDALGIRSLGRKLAYPRVALTAFVASVFSMDLGLTLLGSAAVRLRLYGLWGLSVADVTYVISFTAFAFSLGVLAVGGLLLGFAAIPLPESLHVPLQSTRPLGFAMLALLAVGWLSVARMGRSLRIGGRDFALPGGSISLQALGVAALDWVWASSVLYVLLPAAPDLGFPTFVAIFLACQVLGLLSAVPGGLGVFEIIAVPLLSPYLPTPATLAALLVWRIIYYVLPILLAVSALGVVEALQRRALFQRGGALFGQLATLVVPRLFAVGVFFAGLSLLLAGLLPGAATQLQWLRAHGAGALVDLGHLFSVAAGIALLMLVRGLLQGVSSARTASLYLLAIGSAAALLRGAHPGLALALGITGVSLWLCGDRFPRRGSLAPETLPGALGGVTAVVLAGALWLSLFAHADSGYAHALWLDFGADAEAARALRGAAGLLLAAGLVLLWRLTRPADPSTPPPSASEFSRAEALVASSRRADAQLALLGDKHFLFDEAERGMLMYAVAGRSWVSMGDPLGDPAVGEELVWELRERSHRYAGSPVFYEVGAQSLPLYLDLGLSIHKLGEEGRVPLVDFSLEGSARKGLRQTLRRCEREGCSFEVLPPGASEGLQGELEGISQAWLGGKHTREKGFSLGAFHPDYLARQPIALVRCEGRAVAFANLWTGAERTEVSPDLMRFDPEAAPASVMEYLFVQLMVWGHAEGYGSLCLGMAPLSGLSADPLAPVWSRIGAAVFRHGEHFYNFQGLRAYKEKFSPVWEPRYLASPGGLGVARSLLRVSSLVSGGLKGVVAR